VRSGVGGKDWGRSLPLDFLSQQQRTINNVVGSILKQLVGRGEVAEGQCLAFQKAKREVHWRGLRLADLMGMLRTVIDALPQVFISIDTLDECLPKCLPELIESLRDNVQESPSTRIFLTGRPHVRGDIQRYFTKMVSRDTQQP